MSTIAIIGGGPRGISVLERIAAQMGAHPDGPPTTVHLIDDTEPGAGRVWRTDQTRTLCMNTLADAVTLFTEPGSSVTAPVIEGPTMYEWAQLIRGDVLDQDADPRGNKTSLFRAHPAMVRGEFHSEIASTLPESHPSRALYGEYLRWVLSTVLSRLPESMEVRIHQARAISVNPVICDDGVTRDRIGLSEQSSGDATSDGTDHLFADATIIAPGWTANEPDALEQFTGASVEMHPKLTWVRPENPADQGVSDPTILPAGQEVLVRGLGMGFFDVMAMVTIDRGGKFVPDSSTRSGLRYRPSGREPRLVVASHHGYPYQPKPVLHALPSAAPTPRLQQVLTQITQEEPAGSIDFGATLWPAIIRDAQAAYYSTLLGGTCPGHDANPEALVSIIALVDDPAIDPWNFHTHPAVVELIPNRADRFNLPFYANPVAQFSDNAASSVTLASSVTSETFTAWIGDRLSEDLHEARLGRDSAVKAGLQVIGAVRKAAAIVDQPGRFTLRSRRAEYAELRRVGQMVGSGPPAFRTAELLCLIDSGHVRFLGAHPTVVIDPEKPAFAMSSPTTGDTPVYSQTLVDAWLHTPDARVSADPLTKQLREEGRLRLFTLTSPDTPEAPSGRSFTESSNPVTTTSPEVDLATGLLVHPDGTLDERVHLLGIPLLNFRADMTISPMPRTDPLMLQETDAAAVSALSIASQSQCH